MPIKVTVKKGKAEPIVKEEWVDEEADKHFATLAQALLGANKGEKDEELREQH